MLLAASFRFKCCCLLAAQCILAMTLQTHSPKLRCQPSSSVAELRAAFFYNALKFTLWPAQTLKEGQELNIVLIGSDDVSRLLLQKLPTYTIQKHPVNIRQLSLGPYALAQSDQILRTAHAIYFAEDAENQFADVLTSLRHPVLTSSGIANFAQRGGMVEIAYLPEQQRLEFRVNPISMKQANIQLSSQLLNIARIIEPITDNEAQLLRRMQAR